MLKPKVTTTPPSPTELPCLQHKNVFFCGPCKLLLSQSDILYDILPGGRQCSCECQLQESCLTKCSS